MRIIRILIVSLIAAVPGAWADDATPIERIAFGSCLSQEKPQPIWDAVIAAKPDLFIFLGDNIYADTDITEIHKQKYAQLGANPGFQKLVKACPVMATWDDHDYGADDAGAEFRNKIASQKLFLEFFNEPANSPRRQREGVYVARTFGPPGKRVQVILLDTRYFRSPLKKNGSAYAPNTEAGATFLGDAQWKWLGEQLREPAEVRLIGSSIQVVAEDHPFEKWINVPAERARLFQLLRETKATGVIFISGDRHLAELSEMDADLGYPLFDLTSSGLNMGHRRWRPTEINKRRIATMMSGDNFGLIAIDWSAQPPIVRMQIRDGAGEVALQEKIPLSLLSPGRKEVASAALVAKPTAPAAPLKTPSAISPAEAAKRVGDKVTIEFKVKATGKTSNNSRVFLNSTVERSDPDNFTVVLVMRDVGDALKAAGIAEPAAHYKNKTVRVTGTVALYQDRPQIVVDDADNIVVVSG